MVVSLRAHKLYINILVLLLFCIHSRDVIVLQLDLQQSVVAYVILQPWFVQLSRVMSLISFSNRAMFHFSKVRYLISFSNRGMFQFSRVWLLKQFSRVACSSLIVRGLEYHFATLVCSSLDMLHGETIFYLGHYIKMYFICNFHFQSVIKILRRNFNILTGLLGENRNGKINSAK